MELVSGFLLWISEILGIKWVRQERNPWKKAAKGMVFLLMGIVLVIAVFVLVYG